MNIKLLATSLNSNLYPYVVKIKTNIDGTESISNIFKDGMETHIFWVDLIDSTMLKIIWIKDNEVNRVYWVYDLSWNRSHKGIWIKAIKVCVDFCVMNKIAFAFSPNDDWWEFWKRLSQIIHKKQNEGIRTIILSWNELRQFQEDLTNYDK